MTPFPISAAAPVTGGASLFEHADAVLGGAIPVMTRAGFGGATFLTAAN